MAVMILEVFALMNTVLVGAYMLTPSSATVGHGGFGNSLSPAQALIRNLEGQSLVSAPTSWFLVGCLWVWRGRVKSRWTKLGFDSQVFDLFVRMRGGKTRLKIMAALSAPKDRLQLAQELGLDWKAIDYQVRRLNKQEFVREQSAYGKVKVYELTETGKQLLLLFEDDGEGA